MKTGLLEKPPVVKRLLAKKLRWCGFFLLLGLALLSCCVVNCVQYRNVENRAVRLESVVSRVEEGTDVDGYDEYYVYITYDYNGHTYTKRYMTSTHESWMNRIGETIVITINPDNPMEELDDIAENVFWYVFFGVPVFALGITLLVRMSIRLSWVELYGMRESAIRADLKEAAGKRPRCPFLFSTTVGYLAFGIFTMGIDSDAGAILTMGFMSFIVYCIFRFVLYRKKGHNPEAPYQTYLSTVLDKKIELDSENDKEYYLLLERDGQSRWSKYSQSNYDLLPIGAQITEIVCGSLRLRYWYDTEHRSHWVL